MSDAGRSGRLGWRARPATVRARTTLVATVGVALALALGAVGLLWVLRNELIGTIDTAARTRVSDLAQLARSGTSGSIPVPREDDIAQVVDANGRIIAASPGDQHRPPIATFRPVGPDPAVRLVSGVPDDDDFEDYRVWALKTGSDGGAVTVYLGVSLEAVDETMASVGGVLLGGVPLLVGLFATWTWMLLGRALRPVEAIRSQVAEISEHALDRRVPVPDTDDEIGRLAHTMNAMLDRLQVASEQQRHFVADASHELQSPLTSLRTQLEVAMALPDKTDWPATSQQLLQDAGRLEQLTRDLLFLARADEVGGARSQELLDFDLVVLEEAARLRDSTTIRLDTTRVSAAPVLGAREQLARMTRNLLENAVRHARSTVRITLIADSDVVRLTVHDDGPGVPSGEQAHIFERFVRLDSARTRGEGGTGLGLAIVKAIAEGHGGAVRLESDSGARFIVTLPVGPLPPPLLPGGRGDGQRTASPARPSNR